MSGVFARLVGQDAVESELTAAARAARGDSAHSADPGSPVGSMTHAWLITGPPGSGRSVAALCFAAALQCTADGDPGCGQCRACRRGRPWYCFSTFNATQKMTLTDGTELSPALGIGAFADKTLVHQGQCTKVDPQADAAVAGLLGCGVMAGIGAALNTGSVSRDDTVAVIGCGGVGDAAIAGARLVGARTIIAVDTDDTKLAWARDFGATHTVNARELDVVETIQDLTGGFGADVVIDAVGRPETWKQAFYARDLAGTVVLVGVPTPDMRLDMPLVDFFSRGGSLKSSWYGDCLPERDFPTLIDLHRQGRLPLERFVSERIGLDQVEQAFHKMHAGEVLRSVVVLS